MVKIGNERVVGGWGGGEGDPVEQRESFTRAQEEAARSAVSGSTARPALTHITTPSSTSSL